MFTEFKKISFIDLKERFAYLDFLCKKYYFFLLRFVLLWTTLFKPFASLAFILAPLFSHSLSVSLHPFICSLLACFYLWPLLESLVCSKFSLERKLLWIFSDYPGSSWIFSCVIPTFRSLSTWLIHNPLVTLL